MKKSLIAILMTTVILLSLAAPLISIPQVKAADPSGWYMTVNGVLDSDYYKLYPYETDASLKVGFSKYGELINSAANVGLEYGAVDPFAYPAGSGESSTVPKRMWVQGWLINITYTHRTLGARNVWATAIHADSVAYGKDWIRVDFNNDHIVADVEDPRDSGYLIYGDGTYGTTLVNGGRKTNGTAVTAPIEVLYDGPREFIAVCRTTISDHLVYLSNSTESDVALVQIAITIRFDKVKKDVVLLKDVKSLLVEKEGIKMKIQLSNRGEVDLGTEAVGVSSYAHFWTEGTGEGEGQSTVYNASWQIIQTENSSDTEYPGYTAAAESYPQSSDATYDVAQAINTGAGYVWSAAFWPSLSDWTIDGWDQWWHSLMAYDPHYIDAAVEEPFIPFYIGEWDFVLYHTLDNSGRTQFRGVTQYSVTDLHDAVDDSVIDSEVQYYLDETFNPWDLNDAVHKDTSRWVTFVPGPKIATTAIALPGIIQTTWDAYASFAERLITLPDGILWKRDINYTLTAGTGVTLISALPATKTLKILWSNQSYEIIDTNAFGPGRYEWVTVGRSPEAASVDSLGAALLSTSIKQKNMTIGIAGEDMFDPVVANQIPQIMSKFGAGTARADYKDTLGRAALKDDWCTYWPVASSNIIGTGGPIANLLAYYGNDFTDAFYGQTEYAGTVYSGKITGIPCWNRGWNGTWTNVYSSSNAMGYAVITTTIDINGTVIFEVWGHWGRDTYYATQWLHGDVARGILPGIVQLQDAPSGATSIILKIDYTAPKHPTFSIVEVLGTISERLWYHEWSKPFWTGIAYSETGSAITTPILHSGTTYRIVASEIFWYDYANNLEADAMYYTTAAVEWVWVNYFPAPGGHSFLQINGADVNWGPFSNGDTGHTYSIMYVGQGMPITFQIVDWIDQDYTNNTCHMPISIYIAEYKGGIHDP